MEGWGRRDEPERGDGAGVGHGPRLVLKMLSAGGGGEGEGEGVGRESLPGPLFGGWPIRGEWVGGGEESFG